MNDKPILYMLCGVPGCGKTRFTNQFCLHFDHTVGVSRDAIRFNLLEDGEDYFAHESQVFVQFYSSIRYDLGQGLDVIADATHINHYSRNKLLKELRDVDFDLIYVCFDTPLEVCIERNNARIGRMKVPDEVMDSMWCSYEEPTMQENERCIGVWHVKGV